MGEQPAVFPFPVVSIPAGASYSLVMMPQRPMKLCGLRFGAAGAQLEVLALQVGQQSLFCSSGAVDASTLEQLDPGMFYAPAASPGIQVRIEVRNRGMQQIELRAFALAHVIEDEQPRRPVHYEPMGDYLPSFEDEAPPRYRPKPTPGYPSPFAAHVRDLQSKLRARGFGIAIDGVYGPATHAALQNLLQRLEDFERGRYAAGAGGGCSSSPPATTGGGAGGAGAAGGHGSIVISTHGGGGAATPTPAPAPAPLCGSRRPDTGEKCRQPAGHKHDHHDGLTQSWPRQETPTRRELEERERYLEDPDGWGAWSSATDES